MPIPGERPHLHPAVRHLSAAVRARTILAVCRRVVVRLGDSPDPDGLNVTGAVEWCGAPLLLSEPGRRPPVGSIHLTCDAEELGTLILRGRCDSPRPATAVPGLSEHLVRDPEGRRGDDGPAPDVAGTVVVPVIVEHVQVENRHAHQLRRALPVPIHLFRRARPDLWTVHRADIVTHLNRHHQDELSRLARLRSPLRGVSGVVLREVGPDGLSLAVLTARGVTDLVVPFDPPMTDPRHLGPWFRCHAASAPPPEGPRP